MRKLSTIMVSAVLLGCLMTSCSKKVYYQVYQTLPTDTDVCQIQNGMLVHSDANCEVKYNFFTLHGDAGFWITNKTDSIIYLDLTETFFILNGSANDYFLAREWTRTSSQTVSDTRSRKDGKKGSATMSASSKSTSANTSKERSMVVVPPHATKYVSEYRINTEMIELCGVKDTPRKGKPAGASYTEENSPLEFGNYITYHVGAKGKRMHVSDNFYVSQIINVNRAAMFETVRLKDACGKEKGDRVERLLYNTPDRFYVTYKR